MKHKIYLSVLFLLVTINSFSQKIETEFPVEEIVFYPNSALVKSSKEINLNKGQNIIVIRNLPATVLESSINFWSKNEFTILDLNLEYISKNEKEIASYKDSIKNLNDQILNNQQFVDLLKAQLKQLDKHNETISSDTKSEINDRIRWIDYIQVKKTAILLAEDSLNFYMEKLLFKKELLDKTLLELKNIKYRGQLVVLLDAPKSQNYGFQLSYQIQEAGWKSIYEIDYDENKAVVETIHKAKIFQNSGLDLMNLNASVKIQELPSKYERPLLFPVYCSYHNNEIINYSNAVQTTAGSLRNYNPKNDNPDKEEINSSAQFKDFIEENANDSTILKSDSIKLKELEKYLLPDKEYLIGKINLKSEQTLSYKIDSKKIIPKVDVFLIPSKKKNAYVLANIPKSEFFPADKDSIRLFKNHQYMGITTYFTDALADSVLIPVKIDNLVSSEYIVSSGVIKQKLFGKYKFETKSHLIAIRNNNSYSVRLHVFDQIPIAKDKSIEIEAVNLSGGNYNNFNGKVEWQINLAPKSTSILKVVYAVKYYKNKTLHINK